MPVWMIRRPTVDRHIIKKWHGRIAVTGADELVFGSFRLLPARKVLLEADEPCKLGSRALDLLTALADRAGEIVTKDELIAKVWPGTFVEDNNLRVQMAALRKVLGDGQGGRRYIQNVAGRGYCFVADVVKRGTGPVPVAAPAAPPRLSRIVGREQVLQALKAEIGAHRLVTISGPGGIGKTTVAQALADDVAAGFAQGTCLVELAALADPRLVATAVASALGLPVLSDDPLPALVAFLRDRRLLIVLDNCEHVIDAAAVLAETVLKGAPEIRIVATSREPLRAEGEWVLRLPALDVPQAAEGLTAEAALGFSAVRLFVDRAMAAGLDSFVLTDADVPVVVEICRRLDGMPLALELAAARVDALGLARIASGLDDRLRLLTRGRRTALTRHQTLRATLDWSYDILSERDRVIFERLALFAGGFDLDAAVAVATCPRLDADDVSEAVFDLAAKSLLAFDAAGEVVRYRLLELTGAYALEKLRARGTLAASAARHAAHVLAALARAERDVAVLPRADWLVLHGPQIDDVRSALSHAWASPGLAPTAIALTAAAVPLWTELALFDECRKAAERALEGAGAPDREPRADMQLHLALGLAWMMTHIGTLAGILAAFERALAIATASGDVDYQARILWGIWLGQVHAGRHEVALDLARRLSGIVAGTADAAVADRLIGDSLHCLGHQAPARDHLQAAVSGLARADARAHLVRFYFDQQVMAQATLAHVLWLQGFPDQAMALAEETAARARGLDHVNSRCAALGYATCRIALLNGDLDTAAFHIDELLGLSRRHAIDIWSDWANCFRAGLLARQGALAAGLDVMRTTLARYAEPRFLYFFAGLADVAEMLGAAGEGAWALGVIEDTIRRVAGSDERWCVPEFLRIRGQLLAQAGTGAPGEAEGLMVQAIAMAREQGALSWELRAATSLAGLWQAEGRGPEALALLAAVYARFTEGHETADLKRAAALLAALRPA